MAAVLTKAVFFDDQTPLLKFFQCRINGFDVNAALLRNQGTSRKTTVVLVVLVPDQPGQYSQIARLESERKNPVRQYEEILVLQSSHLLKDIFTAEKERHRSAFSEVFYHILCFP